GPVHVIRADPINRYLLYAGTEFGLFLSLDGGAIWHRQPHLPTVAVHDLVVHPRERELVIATHGRGIYVMDVRPLQQLTTKGLQRLSWRLNKAGTPLGEYRPVAAGSYQATLFCGKVLGTQRFQIEAEE